LRRKNPKVLMSALGQKQTSDCRLSMSALVPKAARLRSHSPYSIDPARTSLIALQIKEDVGVATKVRSKIYHSRRII
jgi:hypothetical protein